MRVPGRKGEPRARRMNCPPRVDIMLVDHVLDGVTRNVLPAQPNHRANPLRHALRIEDFTRSQSVEVPGNDVNTTLVLANRVQQRLNFESAPPFTPVRKPGAQMQPENPEVGFRQHQLQEGMPSPPWQ